MKILIILISIFSTKLYPATNIDLDPIDLNGTIKKESIEEKLQSRRRKLETQTMKRLYFQMEKQRIISEILLSRKMERAMQASLKNIELE